MASTENLNWLLDEIDESAANKQRVKVEDILDQLGMRSFGPIVLFVGLISLAPIIGDIPGVPSVLGILVVVVAVQMLLKRKHIWLPRWILDRSASADKVRKAVSWMRKPARFLGRITRPRFGFLVNGPASGVLIGLSLLVGAIMPLLEFIPFTANIAGAALTLFGLALVARDGLLVMLALLVIVVGVGASVYFFG